MQAYSRKLTNLSFRVEVSCGIHEIFPVGCLYQLVPRLRTADCVLLFLTLHPVTSTWNWPWWSIYTTRIGQCYKLGLAPFPPSWLLNIYQHTTRSSQYMNSRSYYSIYETMFSFYLNITQWIPKWIFIYLLIIYYKFLRFLGSYLWVPINVSAYCRHMRRLKGCLHIRLKTACPWPFGYAGILGRLTTVLGQWNTWAL